MISERMLKKWRKEALETIKYYNDEDNEIMLVTLSKRIVELTHELSDMYLISK